MAFTTRLASADLLTRSPLRPPVTGHSKLVRNDCDKELEVERRYLVIRVIGHLRKLGTVKSDIVKHYFNNIEYTFQMFHVAMNLRNVTIQKDSVEIISVTCVVDTSRVS